MVILAIIGLLIKSAFLHITSDTTTLVLFVLSITIIAAIITIIREFQ